MSSVSAGIAQGAKEESFDVKMVVLSIRAAAVAAVLVCLPSFALADDWVATKLRGVVLQLVDGDWVKLKRGDVVPDDRVIRTLKFGRVAFERGNETIDLGGDTQVQIIDRSGRQFTTVKQYFGTVAVDAEAQNVQHFAVSTPHLAAVVKGTRFTVVSGKDQAKVTVQRGHVAVEDDDTHQKTLLAAGQAARTGDGGAPLEVSGRGTLPVVYAANGKPLSADVKRSGDAAELQTPKAAAAAAREAALADGASRKEADKAAKAAEKEAKEAARESKAEARAAASESKGAGPSSSDPPGGAGARDDDGNSGHGPGGNDGGYSGGHGGGDSGNSSHGGGGDSGGGGGGGESGGRGKKD